ncbi:MAG: DnaJ C-terminal domain-containing protein [Acidimicrobiia bacterium]|nr:MAG: DnaJ C-terminal domain-containing protein [Acidimicrobiia bacterium]
MADYYETLGVARDAGPEEIKRAFRRLARETHPDANPDDAAAEERFRAVAEAYEVLSDPQRRAAYDRGDRVDLGDLFSSFAGVEDLLSRFFGGGFGGFGGSSRGPVPGRDVGVHVAVTLAEAASGVERVVTYRAAVPCATCAGSGVAPGAELVECDRCRGAGSLRSSRQTMFGTAVSVVPCDRCRGRGKVATAHCEECRGGGSVTDEVSIPVGIPPGVEDGTRLRIGGAGSMGDPGARRGDLIIGISVEDDSRFLRHGPDLLHRVSIGIAEAALGTELQIPTVDGESTSFTVPAGTQPGTIFKLARLGMPRLERRGRGDLLIEVGVEVPTSLTSEQEEALRRFAGDGGPVKPSKRRRR